MKTTKQYTLQCWVKKIPLFNSIHPYFELWNLRGHLGSPLKTNQEGVSFKGGLKKIFYIKGGEMDKGKIAV